MKKYLAALLAASVLAAPAIAQDVVGPQAYVGASVGYHDLGANEEDFETAGVSLDDSGVIYGVIGGVDVPVGETVSLGVEGNFHLGSGPIDNEYGVAALVGVKTGANSKIFVKGGYQWVNLDLDKLTGLDGFEDIADDFEVDDTGGDYLVGVGAEFGLGARSSFRIGVDTLAFDTLRPNAAFILKF